MVTGAGLRSHGLDVSLPAVYAAAGALLAGITWVDYVTGYELGLFVLYFVPVGIVAWWGSRRVAVLFALLAAACWYASDRLSGHAYSHAALVYWETFMRLVSYLTTALTLSMIREGTRRRDDLLRVVSHDLRAPLGALSGQAQILRARGGTDPWVAARADAILRSARRMDLMIDDLVDGARQEAGRLRLDLQPVPLRPHLDEMLDRMGGLLDVARVDVRCEADPALTVMADPARLERILVNLISNALKYSPEGRRVRVDGARRGDRVVLTVEDEGPGISREDLPHLFESYFRGRSGQGDQEGLGLGLHSTKLLVEAHGGRIEVRNRPGGGAEAALFLPLTPA